MSLINCDAKYNTVVSAFLRRSFVETTSFHNETHTSCPFVWQNLSNIKFSTLCPNQFVNHINGIHNLSNKAYLLYHLYGNEHLDITPPSWSSALHTIPQLLELLTTYEIYTRIKFDKCYLPDDVVRQMVSISCKNTTNIACVDILRNIENKDQITTLLQQIERATSWRPWCGPSNLWIIKPVGKSCGEGIQIIQGFADTLAAAQAMHFKCIVQKYIEKPLLVRDRRKFDIRQWVLITEVNPLIIFGFSECYCRLSGVEYSTAPEGLQNQQIHLCNHSVQKNHSITDSSVDSPACDTMMSQEELNASLLAAGHKSFYEEVLPKIRDITIKTILSCKDKLTRVGRGFEWLGLDLMVTDELDVRLLEVNVSPDISYSTPITERLVRHAVDDLLILLLDDALDERLAASPSNGSILQWEPWFVGSTEPKSVMLSLTNKKIDAVGRIDSTHLPKEVDVLVVAESILQNIADGPCCDDDEL